MKNILLTPIVFFAIAAAAFAQCQCPGGFCPIEAPANQITLEINPLIDADQAIDVTATPIVEASSDADRLQIVTEATVRVTVGGSCGSGTVVGFDNAGNALILTNAHVAGTKRGRVCDVQRWNVDGGSERGKAAIIASGYARGLSVDFALLRSSGEFAKGVTPVPLADRFPDGKHATNYGCPRCEWPSMQTVQFTDRESQVLRWKPEAIGGRSGSSIVDYSGTGGTPVVVGLLTWGGGGEGLGQSAPFVLDALRGRLPKSFEVLPAGVTEVGCQCCDMDDAESDQLIGQITEDDPKGIFRRPREDESQPVVRRPILGRRETPVLDGIAWILGLAIVLVLVVAAVWFFRE